MIRHVAAVAVVLCLSPSWLSAQSLEITVNIASANVHKTPSLGSPVIGRAPRGAVLEITREVGDWVKVSWPEVQDAIGYVHRSAGTIRQHSPMNGNLPVNANRTVGYTPSRPAPPAMPGSNVEYYGAPAQPVSSGSVSHTVSLGGHVNGSTVGFGGSARGWSANRLGIQVGVSRYALDSATASGRVTSLQFAPSVLYSLRDRVTDYAWLRPYLGAGVSLTRSSQTGFGSTNKAGWQAFGGSEVTFASVPRFALSADVGYRWSRAPFDGFELGGATFSLAGHWYVK